MRSVEIREISSGRAQLCEGLLRSLPAWFGIEGAIRQYAADVETLPMFVAYVKGVPTGFVAVARRIEWTAEIHVMAVHPGFHRRGIGQALIKYAERWARGAGCDLMSVRTPSPAQASAEYSATRAFYFSMGFRPVVEHSGETSPSWLMVKSIR